MPPESTPPRGAGAPWHNQATVSLTPINRLGDHRRTSDRALDELTNQIRTLHLPPGQVLSESELADS